MCSHSIEIALSEGRLLSQLKQYLNTLFANHWIPSHDLSHHDRVWKNACILTDHLNISDPHFFDQLIIASYFHDVGLLTDSSDAHGKESRRACEVFLSQLEEPIRFDPEKMLVAIEMHDDKKYLDTFDKATNPVYKILTVADDLDAFGAVGAYRYIEIYMLRGIESGLIPQSVKANAKKRFDHCIQFMKESGLEIKLVEKYYARLIQLFSEDTFNESPGMLIQWIHEEIVMKRRDPYKFLKNASRYPINGDRKRFFTRAFLSEMIEKQESDFLSY